MIVLSFFVNCDTEGAYSFYKNNDETGKLIVGTFTWVVAYKKLKDNARYIIKDIIEFIYEHNIEYKERIHNICYCSAEHWWQGRYELNIPD